MIGYDMRMHTAAEMAVEDPFTGGLFIEMPDSGDAILEALEEAYGDFRAVAWSGRGAWLDIASMGLTRGEALRIWGADAPASA